MSEKPNTINRGSENQKATLKAARYSLWPSTTTIQSPETTVAGNSLVTVNSPSLSSNAVEAQGIWSPAGTADPPFSILAGTRANSTSKTSGPRGRTTDPLFLSLQALNGGSAVTVSFSPFLTVVGEAFKPGVGQRPESPPPQAGRTAAINASPARRTAVFTKIPSPASSPCLLRSWSRGTTAGQIRIRR